MVLLFTGTRSTVNDNPVSGFHFQYALYIIATLQIVNIESHPAGESSTENYREIKKVITKSILSFQNELLINLQKESKPYQNLFISPIASYISLATLYLGARQKTRAELAEVLSLPQREEVETHLHDVLKNISTSLQNSKTAETLLASGIFIQNDFPLKETYLESIKKYYSATASNVDYHHNAQQATDSINNFISKETKGHVPKFYPQPVDRSTLAVLVNTLYFKARWSQPFDESATQIEKFDNGVKKIDVPMMSGTGLLMHRNNPELYYHSIDLPYYRNEFVMTIILPYQNQSVDSLIEHLFTPLMTLSNVEKYIKVDYKIPKMKFTTRKSLVSPLGLKQIFETPNLSEMIPDDAKISIADMIHACELEVDENGTTANAAVSVEMMLGSSGVRPTQESVRFHVNRSFIVNITHQPTGVTLFFGRVNQPI